MVLFDLSNNKVNFFEVWIFTAGTVSGVGEHSYFGLLIGLGRKGNSGVFNCGVELFFGGELIDAAVSERESKVAFLADETAREISGL